MSGMTRKGYGNRKGVDSQVLGLTGPVKRALTEVSLFHCYGALSQERQELQESGEHIRHRSCTLGDYLMLTGRYIKLGDGVRLMPKAPRLCPQESPVDNVPPELEI